MKCTYDVTLNTAHTEHEREVHVPVNATPEEIVRHACVLLGLSPHLVTSFMIVGVWDHLR